MTIGEFKQKIIYYLNEFDENILKKEELQELNRLKRVIELLEEDVIVKTENGNHFVEDISLNGIVNNFDEGNIIVKLSEV